MKRVPVSLAALIFCTISAPLAAQQAKTVPAVKHGTAPTVHELMLRAPLAPPKAFGAEKEVENRVPDSLLDRKPVNTVADPLALGPVSQLAPTVGLSFGGYDSDDNASLFGFRIMPPDVEGDVGLVHYVQYNNLGWKYWDKATQTENGPFPGNIFWQGFGGVCDTDNAGDPIVLYDQFADRWVFSQFTDPGNPDGHQCFAVTQGNNPAGPYFLYDFVVSPGQFNDYEKITVWTDGADQSAYHMSSNEFAGSFVGVNANAFDRDAMLAGGPASFIQFSLPTVSGGQQNFSLQPSHLEGPNAVPAGTCNEYIQAFDDETWGAGGPNGPDGYRFWTFCVDFNGPGSTFTTGPFVTSANFDAELCGYSRDCIPQPGTTQRLDTLGQFTMYRFANRYFPGQGLRGVISHTVDTGGNIAGVRWAELDVDNHTILDSGTLAPGDGVSRWMPSISMDGVGNIGIGFTKSSASVNPSVYFTGRETGDPAGTLQAEVVCIDGTGSQLGGNRWGDYSSVSIDPADDCTFWVTNEYVETTGSFQWDTQICSYSFPSCGGPGQICGNNTVEGTEVCDGTDLAGETCVSQGFPGGGTLACNGTCNGFDTSQCDPGGGAVAALESGSVTVGAAPVTVNLNNTYTSPVVVTTMQYSNNTQPTMTRVAAVTPTSFSVRLQNPSGGSVASENVSYLVVEEGSWTIDGVAIEAQTYTSTVTDENNSWVGQAQSLATTFTNPVVIGQVMSENDPDWSVFWDQGTARTNPPTATTLVTGKTVCEDTDNTRANETVGFVVIEAGHGTIGGVEYEAALGADTVQGVGDSPPYTYTFNSAFASAPTIALGSLAGMDGGNGGWAQVHGSTLATATSLFLSVDEDVIGDAERIHITEQVAYLAFAGPVVFPQPSGTPVAEWGSASVGAVAVRVNFTQTYVDPVVVATIQYSNNVNPVVTRITNISGLGFMIRLQNPSGGLVATDNVSWMVVEAGDHNVGGVAISASTYNSTVTDENNSWVGQAQSYGQSFTEPVVLGQVMSQNDPAWSVFWDQGTARTNPPSAAALTTGKTVCEDTNTTRANETVGIIVIEAGHGTLGGVEFEAAVGPDTVLGVTNAPPYNYTFNSAFASAPTVAVTTMAGVDGNNGGWAYVFGSTLATTTTLPLVIDEDQIGDTERNHTTEQVAYVAFASSGSVSQ